MADQNEGGDKTEQPTPKKLQDARKKGQISKSRDVTSTAGVLVLFLLAAMATGYAASEIGALLEHALQSLGHPFEESAPALGAHALRALVALSAAVLAPVAAVGVLAEFLQTGPVFALDRVTPRLENMNPVQGLKRMFAMDNLIELAKAAAKTVALVLIGWLSVRALLPQLARLPDARSPQLVGTALWEAARPVLIWAVALFALLSLLDAAYQRWSFMKKMRMSRRDIRQEMKDQEGDPHIKSHRRQAHEEWSQRNAAQAARSANVLVVNPTHVAIAIDYDREQCPVPTIAAKGEDHVARAMREAAEEAGVPIVRNVPLARDLLGRAEVGEIVPADLFEVIAEVVLWAREARDDIARAASADRSAEPPRQRRAPPGEDLTRYARGEA